jgi:glycosyltransferase involved in cell wall biosynthesis
VLRNALRSYGMPNAEDGAKSRREPHVMQDAHRMRLAVVVATYNRPDGLTSLLSDLSAQQLSAARFEVVVVDDGSSPAARASIEKLTLPYGVKLIEQENSGQAVARDVGIRASTADVIVIVDDDMRVSPEFLREHLELHEAGHRLVLGEIRSAPELGQMPLFERFHARSHATYLAGVRRGEPVHGDAVCTGNVSLRREDYLSIGGFDASLPCSEDRDLGIRLERFGAQPTYSERAFTVHHSDHTDLDKWLQRARLYGHCDSRIAEKHADLEYVDPWRFLFMVNPISRPLLLFAAVAPPAGRVLSRAAMTVSEGIDRLGLSPVAVAGTTFVYGLEYFMGVREHAASMSSTLRGLASYYKKRLHSKHQSQH